MIRLTLLSLALLAFAPPAGAQEVIGLEQMLEWTLREHPIAAMADAVEARGPAELLKAKGAFDPKLAAAYDRKEYLGTEYFDYGSAGVEWQSPYALKLAGGYEFSSGTYLNDERTVPEAGQAYLAIKLPLLQGLLTDAVRIDRRLGDIAVERQLALANIIRNELRYDLSLRYAEWRYAERALQIARETEELIRIRLDNTIGLFEQGDKPAVDTLEARVALGSQRLTVAELKVDADLARQALAELYWPMPATARPATPPAEFTVLPTRPDWVSGHPDLLELQFTLSGYQLEQRLKREQLKPQLDVSYYLLGNGLDLPAGDDQFGGPFDRAYKLGATASYPIFNRKANASVQLGQLKITEGEAKLADKTQALQFKAAAYADASETFRQQFTDAEILVTQATRLLAAERELFSLGESTQFLLNSREQSLQKALLTAEKARFSLHKSVLTYRYVTAGW
ncbi:TolC family protein [Neolewinella lacunae]|uniref:TolC family protein n=1 Tax=Neolewinella lacunae TaxID=1517758 RepID=A0A923T840_9BACT|nr:TolC family protein [Neolewinella lacunae]MBC6993553.1 TolC family protein [Neolewinella lacunae]MDN3636171.1 TolC family protein [Neolewinella lacunae]